MTHFDLFLTPNWDFKPYFGATFASNPWVTTHGLEAKVAPKYGLKSQFDLQTEDHISINNPKIILKHQQTNNPTQNQSRKLLLIPSQIINLPEFWIIVGILILIAESTSCFRAKY